MTTEEISCVSLLSLKDFEERGIKIHRNWIGIEALVAVASLAAKKLEEERIWKRERTNPNLLCGFALSWRRSFEPGSGSRTYPITEKPVIVSSVSCSKNELIGDAMKPSRARSRDDNGDRSVAGYTTKPKKLKRGSCTSSRPRKKRKVVLNPNEVPDLPRKFKEKIQQMNGSRIGLVIHKNLFSTDVSDHHCRLSIPKNQIIRKEDFLTGDEEEAVDDEQKLPVKMIEPSLQECEMYLKRWAKPKEKAKGSANYVLVRQWNEFRHRNNLKSDDTIQVWKFRMPDDQLGLAIVLVGEYKDGSGGDGDGDDQSGGTESTTTHEGDELHEQF